MPDIESKDHVERRVTIKERWERVLEEGKGWGLSPDLFGEVGPGQIDIYAFRADHWVFFLNNVNSLENLLEGLRQLSPLVDDALEVAEQMGDRDFRKFKKALVKERRGEKAMPGKYDALLIPEGFLLGALVADKFEVPLGAALIRLRRLQEKH